jgi:DNA-binding transcriptional regulator/RsmH inhibitor MraZ
MSSNKKPPDDVFLGKYCRPLDGMRLCIPSEWARVLLAGGGVVAFTLGEERLALTTRSEAESATDGKELNLVSCKMDERGRVVLPREFRQFLANAKTVLMVGKIGYIELKPCVLSPCSFIQVKNKENL